MRTYDDPGVLVRAPEADDWPRWRRLFNGYADFYDVELTEPAAGRVWSWLLDPNHVLQGVLAATAAGEAVGLAHYRAYPRSLSGAEVGFLDDLFVDPAYRDRGVARALVEAVSEAGRAAGWSFIRWVTADDNARARVLYDMVADKTRWVTYQITL